MTTIYANTIYRDKILVTRESAHLLKEALESVIEAHDGDGHPEPENVVTVDFCGIQGIAPSFLDELVTVLESVLDLKGNGRDCGLIVRNPPTRLSRKFEAIARGHQMIAEATADGSWLLKRAEAPQK